MPEATSTTALLWNSAVAIPISCEATGLSGTVTSVMDSNYAILTAITRVEGIGMIGAAQRISNLQQAWGENSSFAFFVNNHMGEVVGGATIMAPNFEEAEITFWGLVEEQELVAEGIRALAGAAHEMGYKVLFSYVDANTSEEEPTPTESILEAAGFHNIGITEVNGGQAYKYLNTFPVK